MDSLIRELHLDIEVFSSVDLNKCGVYKYAESDDFEILLLSYSINGGKVEVVDLASGEPLPEFLIKAIKDETITKYAYNSTFERVCLSRLLGLKKGTYLSPNSWRCTMTWSAYLGLPFSLKQVGEVLGVHKQKLTEGKELIRYFCIPCRPTSKNGHRTRNYYYHDKEKWELFKKYNIRDVETEMAIHKRISKYPVPEFVWDEYHLSESINDRGVLVDEELVNKAISIDEITRDKNIKNLQKLTSLENPNSVSQLKKWLFENDVDIETLGKKDVARIIGYADDEVVKQVLKLRQQVSKSSIKKYIAMKNARCEDCKVHGMFMFYGANRTGRFSSKIVQLQNLPQNHLTDLEQARSLVKNGDISSIEMLYEDIPDTLSQLIRTAFIPSKGHKFVVCDFSAIEARVIAWYAKEEWRLQAFKNGEDIYCASASQMFHVPVVKHGINGDLRPKGKIAELALGYGGSIGALKAMGAVEMGLKEEELQTLVDSWRRANPNITKFWWDVDLAIIKTISEKKTIEYRSLVFSYRGGTLFIRLPSGRELAYSKPIVDVGHITYMGLSQSKKWERLESYGPKFVENIVQATARDLLLYAMKNLNLPIVMHIHDEVVIDAPLELTVEEVSKKMSEVPSWAKGLILNADGYECCFYKKD